MRQMGLGRGGGSAFPIGGMQALSRLPRSLEEVQKDDAERWVVRPFLSVPKVSYILLSVKVSYHSHGGNAFLLSLNWWSTVILIGCLASKTPPT